MNSGGRARARYDGGALRQALEPPAIEVDFRHRFGRARTGFALDVTFTAPAGVTALFGRSGAGKTSVAQAVAGLLRPAEGRIAVAGRALFDSALGVRLPPRRRRVGYVFQEGRLFPHMSVEANLRFGGRFAVSRPPASVVERVVETLGIAPLLQRRPSGLSGGEKQRVAIGRALLCDPAVLVMDEPLASLDQPRKLEILPYIERLRDEGGPPILYVSHSLEEVARLATTIVVLEGGRVARAGPADAMLSDPGLFPLLGRREAGAILEARVAADPPEEGLTRLDTPGGPLLVARSDLAPGARVRVRVRAQDVMLARIRPVGLSARNVLDVSILEIGGAPGPIAEVSLLCGESRLLARVTRLALRELALGPGARCFAVLKTVVVGRRDVAAGDGREFDEPTSRR